MRHAKGLAAGVEEVAFERLLRREGDAVQQQVQLAAQGLATLSKNAVDLLVLRHVAGEERRVGAEGAGQFLDVVLEALALVGEDELRAGLVPRPARWPRRCSACWRRRRRVRSFLRGVWRSWEYLLRRDSRGWQAALHCRRNGRHQRTHWHSPVAPLLCVRHDGWNINVVRTEHAHAADARVCLGGGARAVVRAVVRDVSRIVEPAGHGPGPGGP